MPGRRYLGVATGAVLAVLAAGCATADATGSPAPTRSPSGTAAAPSGRATPTPTDADPVGLVGSWRVVADGEEPGAVLQLGEGAALWRRCGNLDGDWAAGADGPFLAGFFAGAGACFPGKGLPTPAWMTAAVRYRLVAKGPVLLNQRDEVVARLLPGGRPKPQVSGDPAAQVPVVTDQLRERLRRRVAPLPTGLVPADRGRLLGRWQAADGIGDSSIDLDPVGVFRGKDGCNGQYGLWTVTAGGALLTAKNPVSSLKLCTGGRPAPGAWFEAAARAGFDGEVLVLLDARGAELGRLRRASAD